MSWIRHLAPRPTDYNPGQLQAEAGAVAVNVVGDELAGYWPEGQAPTTQEWQAIVDTHLRSAPLPTDSLLTATDPRDTATIRRT